MPQCLKVCLQVQLHKEVVNCSFVDQADTGEEKLEVRVAGRREQAAVVGQVEALTGQPEEP